MTRTFSSRIQMFVLKTNCQVTKTASILDSGFEYN